MNSQENLKASNSEVSRREVLKALAAGGGALAAAFLPGKWARPLVEVGVLPTHAQGSQLICDYAATITFVGRCPDNIPDCQSEGLYMTFEVSPAQTPVEFSVLFAGDPTETLRSDMAARYIVFGLPAGVSSGLVELFLTMPDGCPVYASSLYEVTD